MKSNGDKANNEVNNEEQVLQNNVKEAQEKDSGSAQKDGFRYDYNDNF